MIVGGYEVARIKGLKYGLNRSLFFPYVVKLVFLLANRILPVSSNLKDDAEKNLGVDTSRFTVVPNGFDNRYFSPSGRDKEDMVTSAAICSNMHTISIKGIDTFLKTAALLPDIPFVLIGIHETIQNHIRNKCPTNVTLLPAIPQKDLLAYFQRSRVYCQLSRREGHPNAICEAMLCECVPVGTDIPGIKQVIGETGYKIPPGQPGLAAEAIKWALHSNKGPDAKKRIKTIYSLEQREKSFESIINAYLVKTN